MLTEAALGLINHILESERWARDQLMPFASQVIRLELGQQNFSAGITATGHLRPVPRHATATVTLALPSDSFFKSLASPFSLKASAQISGSAQLAECLLSVFSHLRWDIESDLSPLLGDVVARRLRLVGAGFLDFQRRQAHHLFRNFTEYLAEESPSLPRRHEFRQFSSSTEQLRDHFQGLGDRVSALES
ncbi:MAG: hypothetical protein WCK63_14380 [Betaproteobacteria bacterium]